MIWKFIKADQFFPTYCPYVRNYKQKISGKTTRGKPLDFSGAEKKEIKKGLKKLFKNIIK